MSKTRDHAAMEKRRQKAAKLFAKDCSAPGVARQLGVARQAAYRWKQAWDKGGKAALASKGPAGPKPKLTAEQTQKVTAALLTGPVAQGCRRHQALGYATPAEVYRTPESHGAKPASWA